MSVYKSQRKEAAAEFIVAARKLREATIDAVKKFPKSYRWIITNNMLTLANEVYTNVLKGNAIYVHKGMSERDYELRHRYLTMAASSAEALLGEITFCWTMVDSGNNFFENKADYTQVFQNWTTAANTALTKIRAVINSDKKRWNNFRRKAEEEKADD